MTVWRCRRSPMQAASVSKMPQGSVEDLPGPAESDMYQLHNSAWCLSSLKTSPPLSDLKKLAGSCKNNTSFCRASKACSPVRAAASLYERRCLCAPSLPAGPHETKFASEVEVVGPVETYCDGLFHKPSTSVALERFSLFPGRVRGCSGPQRRLGGTPIELAVQPI